MNINNFTHLKNSISTLNKDLETITNKVQTEKSFDKGSENITKYSIQIQTEQKLNNLTDIKNDLFHAKNQLQSSENSITSIESVMSRVYQELVKSGSNDHYRSEDRLIIKDLLIDMKEEIINIANTKYNNQYIFSGKFTDREPFSVEKFETNPITGRNEYMYSGSDEKRKIYIDENVKSDYGVTGEELLIDTKLLEVLDNIINLLESPEGPVNNELEVNIREIGF